MRTITSRNTIIEKIPDILYDESRFTLGVPDRVYFPKNSEDVQTCIRDALKDGKSITSISGQTGITGGSVPTDGCYAVSFAAMQQILRVETDETGQPVLFCQPGVSLEEIALFCNDPATYPVHVDGTEKLRGNTWCYLPDPTEMSAHLGGTVATNASGARSFKFGPTRTHIHQISLALANGDTITLCRGREKIVQGMASLVTDQGHTIQLPHISSRALPIKNASGYHMSPDMDLIDLFIGSEGSLAIFTEIGVKLAPQPEIIAGLSFFPERMDAFRFADYCRSVPSIAAIEYFDATALDLVREYKDQISLTIPAYPADGHVAVYWEYIENHAKPFDEMMELFESSLVTCRGSFDTTWSGFESREIAKLKSFRHAVPELVNLRVAHYQRTDPHIRKISTDNAVSADVFNPLFERITNRIAMSGIENVIFGHLGDYHLHINLLPHTADELSLARTLYEEIMEYVVEKGGTISAEHGIGKLKTTYLEKMYPEAVIKEMKLVKKALDPSGMLNPGNIFKQY